MKRRSLFGRVVLGERIVFENFIFCNNEVCKFVSPQNETTNLMKKTIIFACISLFAMNVHSQNPHLDYKYSLKLCNLSGYQESGWNSSVNAPGNYYHHYTSKRVDLLHPVIAFQVRSKKSNFHEVTLSDLKWKSDLTSTELRNDSLQSAGFINSQNVMESSVSLGYEYTQVFFKKKDFRLVPSLGFGVNPYFNRYEISYGTSVFYPSSQTNAGCRITVSPGFSWYFSKRIFADFKAPLCIADASFRKDEQQNPAIPANDRTVSTIDFSGFPKMAAIRLGIGIIL